MSWARLDDGWWSHPKTCAVSMAARGLWATALSWCSQQRRAQIPKHVLPMLTAGDEHALAWAKELQGAGLWDAQDDGWVVHDHGNYQKGDAKPGKLTPEQRSERARLAAENRWKRAKDANANEHAVSIDEHANEHADRMLTSIAGDANDRCGSMPPDPIPIPSRSPSDPTLESVGDLGTSMAPAASGQSTAPTRAQPPAETGSRPTTIPLGFQPHPSAVTDICQRFSVSQAAVLKISQEFVDYWAIGAGIGEKRSNWQAKFREHARRVLSDPAKLAEFQQLSKPASQRQPQKTRVQLEDEARRAMEARGEMATPAEIEAIFAKSKAEREAARLAREGRPQ